MRKRRRLVDAYRFPGFRPASTVRGVFGDPKACIVTLVRRSKKVRAASAVTFNGLGTTGSSDACAISPLAIGASTSNWRFGGSLVELAAG
jgi:hypothetical protein